MFSMFKKAAPRPGSVAAAGPVPAPAPVPAPVPAAVAAPTTAPAAAPAPAAGGQIDSTIRPICFGIDKVVSKAVAGAVGPEKFKRYEHVLYVMAQLSRIVYCDSGIMWHVIEKSLGMSNDIVNKVITAYDWKFLSEKRKVVSSQPGDGAGRPAESYSLVPSKGGAKYGTYISTSDDVTCLMIAASKIRANPNSIFLPTDVIVSFKGSSTMDNFKHDIMSQFTSADIQKLVDPIGVKISGTANTVTGAFVVPLVKAWNALMKGLEAQQVGGRLFITGHSLGGAYASLFAFILAEGKVTGSLPIMAKITSIHLISFGAPCILGENARNTFNAHLDSGLITLDRVVSQKIAARSAATQLLVGGIVGPNDVIPTIPAGFVHPGYRPLNNPLKNFQPEAKGRPYSIDYVRKFYGAPAKTRYREPATWPFPEDIGLGDMKQKAALAAAVSAITAVSGVPEEGEPKAPDVQVKQGDVEPAKGGGLTSAKTIYETNTVQRIPNFVSVQGSAYSYGFAHGEYLGMFFMGGFRLAGMKNPAAKTVAFFDLCADGVKIQYTTPNNVPKAINALNTLAKASNGSGSPVADPGAVASAPASPVAGNPVAPRGGRRTRRRSSARRNRRTAKVF